MCPKFSPIPTEILIQNFGNFLPKNLTFLHQIHPVFPTEIRLKGTSRFILRQSKNAIFQKFRALPRTYPREGGPGAAGNLARASPPPFARLSSARTPPGATSALRASGPLRGPRRLRRLRGQLARHSVGPWAGGLHVPRARRPKTRDLELRFLLFLPNFCLARAFA